MCAALIFSVWVVFNPFGVGREGVYDPGGSPPAIEIRPFQGRVGLLYLWWLGDGFERSPISTFGVREGFRLFFV